MTDIDRIKWRQHVEESVYRTLATLFSRLKAGNRRAFFPFSNCFEMFGVDFLVDNSPDQNIWLLEVNPDPSLTMFPPQTEAFLDRIKCAGFARAANQELKWDNPSAKSRFRLVSKFEQKSAP